MMGKILKTIKKDFHDVDLNILATWMGGAFNNQEQARQTQSYSYVYMYHIPIWRGRTDGYWFYVEQTMGDHIDHPYRQRVYHLTRVNKDLMENKIYRIQDAPHFVRAYETLEVLDHLTPENIFLTPGCSIILRRLNNDSFAGSTLGEGCSGEFRGAMYTTSQIVINEHRIISWDRGYDRTGKQIWGETMGGYIFSKVQSYAP